MKKKAQLLLLHGHAVQPMFPLIASSSMLNSHPGIKVGSTLLVANATMLSARGGIKFGPTFH